MSATATPTKTDPELAGFPGDGDSPPPYQPGAESQGNPNDVYFSQEDDGEPSPSPAKRAQTGQADAADKGKKGADEHQDEPGADGKAKGTGAIDPRLFLRLGRLGLPDAVAERLLAVPPEALEASLDLFEAQAAQSGGTQSAGKDGGQGKPADSEWYKIPEEMAAKFDEETSKAFAGMNDGIKNSVMAAIAPIRESITAWGQNVLSEMAARASQEMDDVVQDLGDEWADVFGQGYGDDLQQNSQAYANRARLFKAVQGQKYKGGMTKRVQQAVKDLWPDRVKKITEAETASRVRDRQGRFMGQGQRREMDLSTMTPKERAYQKARQLAAKAGWYGDD